MIVVAVVKRKDGDFIGLRFSFACYLLVSARVHHKHHWQSSTEVLRRGAGYSLSNEALRMGGGRRGAKGQTREAGGGRWEREREKRRRKQ